MPGAYGSQKWGALWVELQMVVRQIIFSYFKLILSGILFTVTETQLFDTPGGEKKSK